ncbi:MAG: uL15m family ribosomal protein [Polyangiaceae bacterium]
MADILSKLGKPAGLNRNKTRKGCGVGSGLGKTAGPWPEVASTPATASVASSKAVRRPRAASRSAASGSVPRQDGGDQRERLEAFAAGSKVDERALRDRGLIKGVRPHQDPREWRAHQGYVTVTAHMFFKTAAEKITKAGGKVLVGAAEA